MGVSYGAFIALQFAAHHPERVRSLGDRIRVRIGPGAGHFLSGSTADLVKELLPDRS